MIGLTTEICKELTQMVFKGCEIKCFLDKAEEIIINPLAFSGIKSKSFAEGVGYTTYRNLQIQGSKIPITTIDTDLINFIDKCILHIVSEKRRQQWYITSDDILDMLLQGDISSYSQLISFSEVPQMGEYFLVVLKLQPNNTLKDSTHLRQYIRKNLPESWCSWNNLYFVILINAEHYNIFTSIAKKLNYRICIGKKYHDIMETKHQYDCILYLPAFNKSSDTGIVHHKNYPESNLVFKAKIQPQQIKTLCSDSYLKLLESDREQGTQYVTTIRTLIDCNFNLAKTAKHLFIHINTLSYRLDKIEELIGVDIKMSNELYRFLFSDKIISYVDTISI